LPIINGIPGKVHLNLVQLREICNNFHIKTDIITQNLDILHEKAELKLKKILKDTNSDVIHIHGWVNSSTCSKCNQIYSYQNILETYKKKPEDKRRLICGYYSKSECDTVLTPDMIEYGENLKNYGECVKIAEEADCIIILGTSLREYPANELINIVKKNNGSVILLNRSDTPKDDLVHVHERSDLIDSLPMIVKSLKEIFLDLDSISKKERKILKKIKVY